MVIKRKIEINFDLEVFTISKQKQKQENRATFVTKKSQFTIKLKLILPYIQSRKSKYLLS
jgi:hypothetical protein